LIYKDRISEPKLISTEGRSAGGLTMGCLANMRPDLIHCVVSGVGFVDVLCTMADDSIPLTTSEWGCVGNPNTMQGYTYIKSYCPMSNIAKLPYPKVLATAGLHDPRVPYWEIAKYVQRLRENTTRPQNEIIAKFEMGGHFSANDRYIWWREVATYQAWLVKNLTGNME
jgi:oligopeptidase B